MHDRAAPNDPPSRDWCLTLIDEHGMLPNIRAHSIVVCDVSMLIAEALTKMGHNIDLALVEAGALLHDITKARSLHTKENHARTGERLLRKLGVPTTGIVVGEHIIPRDRGDRVTPCEIVAYADKRVLHDRVVELDERFQYLIETYGGSKRAMAHFEKMLKSMNHIEHLIESSTGLTMSKIIH